MIGASVPPALPLPWWPPHPVVFLMWGSWTAMEVWMSFLVGWAVKTAVVRYGGSRTPTSSLGRCSWA